MSENKRVTIPFLVKVLKPIVDLVRTKADKTDIVQSDWNQTDATQNNFIKNKPEIPSVAGFATESYVDTKIAAIPTPDVSEQISNHNISTDAHQDIRDSIPTTLSQLTNDAGYLTQHQDLTAYATKTYADNSVSTHNVNTSAHNDIRDLISGLSTRLNALADSDDTTLDQMSEIVAYIKSNKSLIEDVTTNKVNVSDIIDNLTTNVANKPLSAAQGVALKALIDALDTDKLDASALTTAVEDALAQAKASGEFKGDYGVGVSSVRQTTTSTADDGNNIITVTLTDGTTSTFTVQNGSKGSKGDSPVRGTDYWTDADKAEIKSYVDTAILGGEW